MSDEPQPPPLRLRPRKRDDEPAAAAPTPPAPPVVPTPPAEMAPPPANPVPSPAVAEASVSPAPAETPLRFRLKPKLVSDADAKPAEPTQPVTSPGFSPSAPPEDLAGIPRLKLRMIDPVAADSGTVVPPSPPSEIPAVGMSPPAFIPVPPVPAAPTPPPVETVSPQPDGGQPPVAGTLVAPFVPRPVSPPPPPHVTPLPLAKPALAPAKKKRTALIVFLIGLPVALGGAAYFIFMGKETPAAVVAGHAVPAPKPAPAPVESATTVVPPRPAPAKPPVSSLEIPPLPPPPQFPQPGSISASKPAQSASAVVSPAFRAWIDGVRITGVLSGSSPRAIINGRLMRPGDMVDASAGIVFDRLDVEGKQLVFRDRSGVSASKSY